jgi:hypothetical protein
VAKSGKHNLAMMVGAGPNAFKSDPKPVITQWRFHQSIQQNPRTDRKQGGLTKKIMEALTGGLLQALYGPTNKCEQFCTDRIVFALIGFPLVWGKYECISHFGG